MVLISLAYWDVPWSLGITEKQPNSSIHFRLMTQLSLKFVSTRVSHFYLHSLLLSTICREQVEVKRTRVHTIKRTLSHWIEELGCFSVVPSLAHWGTMKLKKPKWLFNLQKLKFKTDYFLQTVNNWDIFAIQARGSKVRKGPKNKLYFNQLKYLLSRIVRDMCISSHIKAKSSI